MRQVFEVAVLQPHSKMTTDCQMCTISERVQKLSNIGQITYRPQNYPAAREWCHENSAADHHWNEQSTVLLLLLRLLFVLDALGNEAKVYGTPSEGGGMCTQSSTQILSHFPGWWLIKKNRSGPQKLDSTISASSGQVAILAADS